MEKTPTINVIFEKEKSGNPTKNSLLCQDILRYYPNVMKPESRSTFTFSELAGWLVEHNLEISNYYKDPSTRNTTRANKVAARWDRIKRRFEELKSLELIEEIGSKRTTKGISTPLYQYSNLGQAVSLIIQLKSLKDKNKIEFAIEEIYRVICSVFTENQSASDKYALTMFRSLWNEKFFTYYLEALAKTLGCDKLFDEEQFFPKEKVSDFLKIKQKAFNQLSEDDRKLFLYSYKILVEAKFYQNSQNTKGFEEVVFKCRGTPYQLAIEAFCINCKMYFPLGILTLEYFNVPTLKRVMTITCPKCRKSDAMRIPLYRGRESILIPEFQ